MAELCQVAITDQSYLWPPTARTCEHLTNHGHVHRTLDGVLVGNLDNETGHGQLNVKLNDIRHWVKLDVSGTTSQLSKYESPQALERGKAGERLLTDMSLAFPTIQAPTHPWL